MKSLGKAIFKNEDIVLLWVIGFSFALKVAYAFRDPVALFNSGPDANGYIPFAISFQEYGFFSPNVEGPPYYPSGYPYLVSLLISPSELNWMMYTQILQIFAFSLSLFLYFKVIRRILDQKVAWISTLILAYNPAWAVVNGEAMYETTLLSIFILSISLWPRESSSHKWLNALKVLGSGLLSGFAFVVHPRIIPIYFLIFLFMILARKISRMYFMILIFSMSIFPIIFSFRNLIAEKQFTLMSAFWASVSWNDFLSGCNSIHCVFQKINGNEVGFLASSLRQAIEFWSPHSGPMMKGTWYHNVSLLSQINNLGFTKIAIYLSVLVSLLTFIFWIVGTLYLYKKSKTISFALFFPVTAIWFTDIVVYPDNRHRLIALVFMLPAQAALINALLEKYCIWRRNYSTLKNQGQSGSKIVTTRDQKNLD